jgi:hypothetical protein
MGENQSISADQIQRVLGSEQVNALAARLGVDPAQLRIFWPNACRKSSINLRQKAGVDPTVYHQQGLADLVPALLQSLGGKSV